MLIGEPLAAPAWRAAVAVAAALLTVVIDFWIVLQFGGYEWRLRAIAPAIALLVYLRLARGDLRATGLRLVPQPGLRYWAWMLGVTIVAVSLAVAVIAGHAFYRLQTQGGAPPYLLHPTAFWPRFVFVCVLYPLTEEATFRVALCTALAPVIGPWPTVLFSGALFAAVHFLYGNPNLSNFLAGYCLAWAYLKSGSMLIPVVLHSFGNLLLLFAQMAAWHWFTPG